MPPKKHLHLSPEERRELKKQKKIERKLRIAEKKKQIKRDHLEREVKYGRLTVQKYEKNWREMLIKVALPRMRDELEFAWHNFERVVDCKDFTISLLMDEIKDAEEQYMYNFRAHSENLEKLLWLFHDRLEELKADFEAECKLLQDRCNSEFQDIKSMYGENFDYLKTMLFKIEMERKEHNRLKKGEYFSRLDEVEVKNQLVLQKLRATLEKNYQNMFEDAKKFIKDYNKRIRERKKEHNMLKNQDDQMQELIGQQFRHIKRCNERVRQLRTAYIDMKQSEGGHLADLQAERNFFSTSFLTLKAKLENDKKDDFDKLAMLGGNASEAFDYLEALNKKGEMILTLAAVCRKLETQKEKILTFPSCTHGLPESNIDLDDEMIEGVVPEMELFWQRLGQAFGVHYTLEREKTCLIEENELLAETHNAYCENLLFPPIKPFKDLVAIPKTEATLEFAKYEKYEGKNKKKNVYDAD